MHNYTASKNVPFLTGTTNTTGVNLEAYDIIGVIIPALTNSVTVTLQVSDDNATFYNVYDQAGTQILTWGASNGARAFGATYTADLIGHAYARVVFGGAPGGSGGTIIWRFKDSLR